MPLSPLDSFERASRHPITCDKPAVDFFEGALLGNGGLGVVVTTRPDGVMIHFSHNNVWDIRVAENHADEIGVFRELFKKVKAIPASYDTLEQDEWYRRYCDMAVENYLAPYPRPFPCGSLLLAFDRREAELMGHRLDVATGLCEVFFDVAGQRVALRVFADMQADRLWLRAVDEAGQPCAAPFNRVRLIPDPDTPKDIPPFSVPAELPAHAMSFRQVLPARIDAASSPNDRAFRLTVAVDTEAGLRRDTRLNWHSVVEQMDPLERALPPMSPFVACVQLDEGLASVVGEEIGDVPRPTLANEEVARTAGVAIWQEYWSRSGVALDDEFLECIWYWNLYFLNCSAKPGVTCPGLFANWSYRNIGTAWHGDYHMNYNTQQPFWVTFSSNHVDKHVPYVDLVHFLLPISRKWARDYYGLRGAYFPHSAYPVEMTMSPYPVPTWGWEICETPWAVQSLWWHYLYTQDEAFLRRRAFEPMKDAVLFLVDYMKRPDAHGPQWGDDKYHIFPTVVPELYGLTPGFKKNHDCLVDLTLTKFVFNAFGQACAVLGAEADEAELLRDVRDILAHFADHPTAESPRGRVFISVEGESADVVYNVPNSTMTVFPGEEHGLHSSPNEFELAANSYRQQRNEGGNDLVFLNLQGARLGLLNLERFKRQVAYCLLPNGACTDLVLQTLGRYQDARTPYKFMANMGIWFENFALPVVVNECLLQSYSGVLRFFPNWPKARAAEFRTLRAAGAFLVSAACASGEVAWVEVHSEAGRPLKLLNPWPGAARCTSDKAGERLVTGEIIELPTTAGETIRLTEA